MFGLSADFIEKIIGGKKRTENWYSYLFDVVKARYLGGSVKKAYRKYELYCELTNEPKFPYERLMDIYDQIYAIYKEIREF